MSKRFLYFIRCVAPLFALGLLASCQLNPLRVFQAKVPPPAAKSPQQIEGERQAAELLTHGKIDPPSLEKVADSLSDSLGKPDKPLPSATPAQVDKSAAEVVARMEANIAKMQKTLDAQNKFIAKYAGKEIEGTGFSMLGPGMTALVIGLIVLAIACPPALTLMAFAYRRLKAAAGIVVNELEEAASNPEAKDAVAKIKSNIGAKMKQHPQKTTLLKEVVTNLKG